MEDNLNDAKASSGVGIFAFKKIKNFGVFQDFIWPRGLDKFKTYNLIYGWNGSGKTTLSRMLRYLENNESLPHDWQPEFTIESDRGEFQEDTPDRLSNCICVFNEDFVAENINWGAGQAKKLLISKATRELADKFSDAHYKLKENQSAQEKEKESLETKQIELDNFLTSRAREIKKRLTTNVDDDYRNYNRTSLHTKLSALENQGVSTYILDSDKEQALNTEIQQNALPDLSPVRPPQTVDASLLSEAQEILKKSPTSAFIEALRADTDLNAWVKTGYDIHIERTETNCQFCSQPLPDARMEKLEKHFSDEYKNFIADIDRIGKLVKSQRDKYADINLVHSADFFTEFHGEYKTSQDAFYKTRGQWQELIDELLAVLRQKKENPFNVLEEIFTEDIKQLETTIQDQLTSVNELVEKHNHKAKNLNNHIAKAKKDLENAIVGKLLEEWRRYKKAIIRSEEEIEALEQPIATLTNEIKEIESKTIQPKIGEADVNKDLQRFLGRDDITLEYEEDGYSIKRNGEVADNLSEGEKTAIALIYFLNKIREGNPKEEKIIVIDDPISSLDNQSTHSALGFIKDKVTPVKQVFLFTHNFNCFKEVKRWRKHKPFKNQLAMYMLDCTRPATKTSRVAKLGEIDPLLEKYDSEYHFLFSRIYQYCNNAEDITLEEAYPLALMGRKVLETFLTFKKPQEDNDYKRLEALKVFKNDEIDCLIRFLNGSAHADAMEPYTEFPNAYLEEIGRSLKLLIKLIEETDKSHFNGMKAIVDGAVENNPNE